MSRLLNIIVIALALAILITLAYMLTVSISANLIRKDTVNGASVVRTKTASRDMLVWNPYGSGTERAWPVLCGIGKGSIYRGTENYWPEEPRATNKENQSSALFIGMVLPFELLPTEPEFPRIVQRKRDYPNSVCIGCFQEMYRNGRIEL